MIAVFISGQVCLFVKIFAPLVSLTEQVEVWTPQTVTICETKNSDYFACMTVTVRQFWSDDNNHYDRSELLCLPRICTSLFY